MVYNGDKIEINELGKQIYIQQIKDKVKQNKFEIVNREKNELFIQQYNLNKSKIKQMLLSLNPEDIQYELKDKEYLKYGLENLIVLKKQYELINFYGKNKIENIYIKIKMKDKWLPVISFHFDE